MTDSDPLVNEGASRSPLFRTEAMDAAMLRHGSPVRPVGLTGWVLTAFMFALLVAVAIFLALGQYSRKETVPGVLQPTTGSARIAAQQTGVVTRVFVEDGEKVLAGQPLFAVSADLSVASSGRRSAKLSDLLSEGSERELEAVASQSRATLETGRRAKEDIAARRQGLVDDQQQLRSTVVLQIERIRLTEETLAAGKALHDRNLFSSLQLRQREEALLAAKQQLAGLERELRSNASELMQLEAEEGRVTAQMAQAGAEIDQSRAQLDQRRIQLQADSGGLVTASRSGRVLGIQVREGAPVQGGRTLATVVPEKEALQAELWVPSRAAGFVEVGDEVRVMYDAFPYQKFGVGRGRVQSVGGVPTDPQDMPVPIETKEALYRVVVLLDSNQIHGYGREWPLVPGMRLAADLILDKRSFWEWILDPLIAAQRRAGGS